MRPWSWLLGRWSDHRAQPKHRFPADTSAPTWFGSAAAPQQATGVQPICEFGDRVPARVIDTGLREIIFDLETTGISTEDRIIEIAAIELVNRVATGCSYQTLINPNGRTSHPRAEEKHGIRSSELIGQPLFAAAAPDFLAFVGEARLIAHNCFGFDQRMLNRELARVGLTPIPAYRFCCTLEMARSRFGGNGHSLDALCDRLNINRSHRSMHRALIDCELLAAVYVKLAAAEVQPAFPMR